MLHEQLSLDNPLDYEETRAAFETALALEARRTGARFVAAVTRISSSRDLEDGVENADWAAALLLGYMHRYDDFEISVFDAATNTTTVHSPRQLYSIAVNGDADEHEAWCRCAICRIT